ncbi:hypothetical protein K435DRAFT_816645 [Dendrothele bispora CBS 962.96]|uniref:Peptidase A22B, signal peptide peptidase n=1 Tax=Dendrothele bispora (strain CBS 962.96) TaxID=1314807 RepID=A0A4S8MQI9_DENBC|nr:hypothetical protein K435DRAFT_816645 [Dendrothele bispora CBS 962.96]
MSDSEESVDWNLLSSYAGLLFLACSSIYAGSFGSLPNPKTRTTPTAGSATQLDEEDEEEEEIPERVSLEDAWIFPIIGSMVLFGLFLVIKFFGKEWINWFLGWYFSIAGIGSVWKSSIALLKYVLGPGRYGQFQRYTFSVKKGPTEVVSLSWRTPSLVLLPLSIIPSALYKFSSKNRKSVLLTDILSLSFSHNALSLMKIDSFVTGIVLLSGLFLYDIWWVFGTPAMVEVATQLDVPIKLLWPKSMSFSDSRGFTMLGLGDVVIPGVFVALALRYDYHRYRHRSVRATSFSKPYFYASLTAYILGLVTTMAVMHIFKAAQPALLYLSPACIVSFVLTAVVRGELKEAWHWTDVPEPQPKEKQSRRQGEKQHVDKKEN